MIIWLGSIPLFVTALAVLFLPGFLIAVAAGARWLNSLALAIPLSLGVSGVLAIALGFVGLPLSPTIFFSVSAVLVAVVFALGWVTRRILRRRGNGATMGSNDFKVAYRRPKLLSALVLLGAFLIPMALIAFRYLRGIGNPQNISQTFDDIFHLNAVKFIMETGQGSTLKLGNLTETSAGLYPAALHDSMALIGMTGGFSVPEVINATTVVMASIAWPLGMILLTTKLLGESKVVFLGAGLLSMAFSSFPYLLASFGVLYPNHAAFAMLPVSLALTVEALGLSRTRRKSRILALVALVATLPGVALTHPSAVMALLFFAVPLVFAWCVQRVRKYWGTPRASVMVTVSCLGVVVYLIATYFAAKVLRPEGADTWPPVQTPAQAFGEALSSAPLGAATSVPLLALTLVGIFAAVRNFRTKWPLIGFFLVGVFLFVVTSSFPREEFRLFFSGIWYSDSPRLAALLPLATIPLATYGIVWLAQQATFAWRRVPGVRTTSRFANVQVAVLLAGGLVLCVLLQNNSVSQAERKIADAFALTPQSRLITTDEMSILTQVDDIVPEDESVVADPWMGGSLVYALGDRRTVAPHIFGKRSTDEELLLTQWDEAAYNTQVCNAVRDTGAYWALDFGQQGVHGNRNTIAGLDDVVGTSAPGVRVAAQQGTARLLELTACR